MNRLYYAAFHAAKGALHDDGHNLVSHGGVLSLVGSELVVSGDVSRDLGPFLNHLSELRQQADYGYEAITDDIGDLVTRTEQFVTKMECRRCSHCGFTGTIDPTRSSSVWIVGMG